MAVELRDYQAECVKRVLNAYGQNPHGSELLVLPTGSGKTIVFCQVIHELAKKHGLNTLIVAHRDELLDQAADKYRIVKPEAIIGKVGSGAHEYGGEVTVASIATISRPEHLKRLKAIDYGLIITDEAHHSQAESYQKVYQTLPDAFHLMVTATEDRMDGKKIIDKPPLYEASIIDMVARGYLCDLKAIAIKTEVNLDNLHTQMGDYNEKELEAAVDTEARNRRVVEAYQEHAAGRRAICFGVTVAHATHLAEAFKAGGVASEVVSGNTPLDERKRLYRGLHDGSIRVLTNVQVLTEGFDEPLVDCVIMARPTQSRALFVQCVGRGLRLAPAKDNCIILDLTDNCFKHRLEPQNLSKALGKDLKDNETLLEAEAREKAERENAEKRIQVRKLGETRDKDLSVNLLQKLQWVEKDNGLYVLEVGLEKHRIALVPSEQFAGYYSVWARLAPSYEAQLWFYDAPLDWAQQEAEKRARKLLADPKNVKLVDRNAGWRNDRATEVQLEKLAKYQARFKLQYDPETVTKGEASDMLDVVYSRFQEWREKREGRKVAV